MNTLIALAILAAPFGVSASGLCERQAIDRESPAGFAGSYEIIGKDPNTGNPYSGTLVVGYGVHAYSLARTIQGTVSKGEAWLERCGMDKIQFLAGQYRSKSGTIEIRCRLGADGDNYYRTTCRTRQPGNQSNGLESWFQNP